MKGQGQALLKMDAQGNESEGGDGNERRKGGQVRSEMGSGILHTVGHPSETVRNGSEDGEGHSCPTWAQQPELIPRASAFSSSYTLNKAGRGLGDWREGI